MKGDATNGEATEVLTTQLRPCAITMWDFSWLERRWPGAGYEDWDLALDELVERGYDAVRIDAYPHLVSADPQRQWTLLPPWTQNTWGAQSKIQVQVLPGLVDFIRKAGERGVRVALSTWFRQDLDDHRMRLSDPANMAQIWIDTLRVLDEAGVLEHVLYVDLCNEFPVPLWTPFLYGSSSGRGFRRTHPRVPAYMSESIERVRAKYPELAYTYSFGGQYDDWQEQEIPGLDFLEPHVWMALDDVSDYYLKAGYNDYEQNSPMGYDNLVVRGGRLPCRAGHVGRLAVRCHRRPGCVVSGYGHQPLITTECWGCHRLQGLARSRLGLDPRPQCPRCERALATRRWIGVATSNFCGPQFRGCSRELGYHQRLTKMIKEAPVAPDLTIPAPMAALLTPK